MYTLIEAKKLSNGAPGRQIYTKSGQVRKDCKITTIDGSPEEVKKYLDDVRFKPTGKPYVFTHIVGEGIFGTAIVKQDYNGIPVSPVKLAELYAL